MTQPFSASALDMVGLIGVAIYLGAYAALQLGFIRGQSYLYAGLVIAAASCVLIGLTRDFNLSAAVIQVSMIAISVAGILRLFLLQRLARFSAEEAALLRRFLPDLPSHMARQFFRAGQWTDWAEGRALTREAAPVEALVYLARGEATVEVDGHLVALCTDGTFIGELTCLDGETATATVRLSQPSRCFSIRAEDLRRLIARRPELEAALRACFHADARRKLLRANRVGLRLATELRATGTAGDA